MLTQSLRFGTILGIPVGVNYSWFVIFVLITLSLTTQFTHLHPDWSYSEHLIFGIATSLLFFISVLLHELGHSIVALRYHIPVKAITLFVFGGVAHIGKEPEKPVHEFNIAIAGPIVSTVLGGLFYLLAALAQGMAEGVMALGEWLGRINLMLALFNLLPGFPLDGGRLLRAVVWKYTGSYERATVVAAGSGQLVAYGFILFGIWEAFRGEFISGLWIGFIGWFLLTAAQATGVQLRFRSALRGVTASDVMSSDCLRLPGNITIASLVDNYLLKGGVRCSMIMDGDQFRGLVTLHEIKRVPRDQWAVTSLQTVMVPDSMLSKVSATTPIDVVLQRMNEENINQIPVVENGRLVGIVSRDRLLSVIQMYLELKT
jgi:Zn-dependent protease